MEDLSNLKRKVKQYQDILGNTKTYRETWKASLKQSILDQLHQMIEACKLNAEVEIKDNVENLEAIVVNLGETRSGLYEKINKEVNRHLIKHNGSLIYQQLFNGKIIVLINFPVIEGYGQPHPPRTIAIYRPEEIKPPFMIRHMVELMKEVTNWEDYDDDDKQSNSINPIGFNMNLNKPEEEG
ncbi:MAG: hypothetical protein AAF985_08945 [Bacteroidota bacterium]